MLTLRLEGNEHVIRAFDAVTDKSRRAALMDEIGNYGVSSTQQRFIDEIGPGGIRWKKSHRASTTGGKTLRNDGFLYQSLTHQFNDHSTEWGTNVPYAAIHQYGGTIVPKSAKALAFRMAGGQFVLTKKVVMPARPFLGLDASDEQEIEAITTDWFLECIR